MCSVGGLVVPFGRIRSAQGPVPGFGVLVAERPCSACSHHLPYPEARSIQATVRPRIIAGAVKQAQREITLPRSRLAMTQCSDLTFFIPRRWFLGFRSGSVPVCGPVGSGTFGSMVSGLCRWFIPTVEVR